MTKAYETHENVYRRMKKESVACWEELMGNPHRGGVGPDMRRFLGDVLCQPWAPHGGAAMELGCGTGPLLRWLARRGFDGLGVDVSPTAIAMARSQSRGMGLRFMTADACGRIDTAGKVFDLIVDGHCLHCITAPADRKRMLAGARRLLKPGGVMTVATMCGPVNRFAFRTRYPRQRLLGSVVYVPVPDSLDCDGLRSVGGRPHLPVRYLGHWRHILKELRCAGLRPRLTRLAEPSGDEPVGDLCIAAVRQ